MRYSRHFQKSLAIMVLLSFSLLIQSAPFPVSVESDAVPVEGPTALASADQPGATEIPEASTHVKKKRFPLVEVVFGTVLVGIAAVALLPLLTKPKYDIRGTWLVTLNLPNVSSIEYEITFPKSDSFQFYSMLGGNICHGNYTVDGEKVYFKYYAEFNSGAEYTGTFTDQDHLSGTTREGDGSTGTWTAVRIANGN